MKKITYISLLFFFTSIFFLFMWFFWVKNIFAFDIVSSPDNFQKYWLDFWYKNIDKWRYSPTVCYIQHINDRYLTYDWIDYLIHSNHISSYDSSFSVVWFYYQRFLFYNIRVNSYTQTSCSYSSQLNISWVFDTQLKKFISLPASFYYYWNSNFIFVNWNNLEYKKLNEDWTFSIIQTIAKPSWFVAPNFTYWAPIFNSSTNTFLYYVWNKFYLFNIQTNSFTSWNLSSNQNLLDFSVMSRLLSSSRDWSKFSFFTSLDYDPFYDDNDNIIISSSWVTFGRVTYYDNPKIYFNSSDNSNIYSYDMNCNNPAYTSCLLDVVDGKKYCSNWVSFSSPKKQCDIEVDLWNIWWWGWEICTENNSNCTCIIYTPQTYENQLKYDYSIYWNNPTNYATWSTNSIYFRFKNISNWPLNTLDFTFWDFSNINFYDSWWLAIFDEDQKYMSFLNGSFNVQNWFFKKNELNIKNYSWSINFIQLDSLQDYNFNLYWLNQKWEKELIWNFKTNTPNHLQNTYFNFSIEFDWYQYWWYSIKKIFLKDFDKVYWQEKLSCVNKKTWKVYYGWQEVDYNTLDNLDPNIIKDIIDWKIESDFKQTILNDIQSVINSQSLSSVDVSWSWIINSTIWTGLNTIQVWDFWTWSCRMFWDNLQFLYYSNWQVSFNFSFWDFDNMFLDWLSFLWDKIIGVFTAPLNNTVSFITILTPFWTNDKAYCLFGNVVTYQPHKMFIWTPYHNKMLLIDYIVLFAYWTFLLWTLALMNWIVSIWLWELPTVTTTSTNSSTTENKNIDWRIVRISSNKRTDVSTMRHKKTMRYK